MQPPRRPLAKPDNRAADLARIHILKKDARLTVDDYRQLVHTLSNGQTNSAGELDMQQRLALIDHLQRLIRALGLAKGPDPQWAKLRALWGAAARAGAIGTDSEQALNKWVFRQYGKASARWLTSEQTSKAIEAVKAMIARKIAATH